MFSVENRWPHYRDSVKVEWNLGKRCNLDCTYCPAEIHDNFSSHKDLSTLYKTVDTLAEMRIHQPASSQHHGNGVWDSQVGTCGIFRARLQATLRSSCEYVVQYPGIATCYFVKALLQVRHWSI